LLALAVSVSSIQNNNKKNGRNVQRMSGGQILISSLVQQGVEHVFCVPGESYLAALDAMHDSSIKVTVCRQEGGAAMMAEAAGKLTGRPGICFVTRGPGATNASPGIHIAAQDSTPLILFVGQVERGMREREAFQEVDYKQFFGGMAKWVAEIDDPSRIQEFVSRAFHVATSGRPGPVVLSLPEDVLTETVTAKPVDGWRQIETHPGPAEISEFIELLNSSQRPFAILGGSRWSSEAVRSMERFAERHGIAVGTSFRRHALFDPGHPCYAGEVGVGINPKLKQRIQESDLILLLGGRLSELPSSSYTLLDIPQPSQKFVHVHPGTEEIGRVYRPHLGINASPTAFAAAIDRVGHQPAPRATGWLNQARADYLEWSEQPPANPGAVQIGAIVQWLRQALPDDSIVTTGAGNYAGWVQRFFLFRKFGTQLAPTSGSMGYGIPAAVAAKRLYPDRTVVAFAGDGCFLMNGQEFATAVQYQLPIIVIVVNNGMYGTIRMHQEREYPERIVATNLVNPDFAQYARAFGGHGETVNATEQFASAFDRARASKKPAIIEVQIDPEAISPTTTLSEIRRRALEAAAVRA
jgi:acetolactate synthase-1/2/3 large subunit